jgi:hypothetical protein
VTTHSGLAAKGHRATRPDRELPVDNWFTDNLLEANRELRNAGALMSALGGKQALGALDQIDAPYV